MLKIPGLSMILPPKNTATVYNSTPKLDDAATNFDPSAVVPLLLRLPMELLIQIIDVVQSHDPYDFKNIALCCKHLYSVIVPRLKYHLAKRKKYQNMVVGYRGATMEDGVFRRSRAHPLLDLARVLSNAQNKMYPKALYIATLEEGYWTDTGYDISDDLDLELNDIIDRYGDKIRSTVKNVCKTLRPQSSAEDAEQWTKMILGEGHDLPIPAAAAVLLLAICPNLELLDIHYNCEYWLVEFKDTFEGITQLAMDPNADELRAFRKLSYLRLTGDTEDGIGNTDAQLLCPFLALPTMKMVSASLSGSRDCTWSYKRGISEVAELSFEECDIDPASVRNLLYGLRRLRSFCYSYCRDSYFNESSWQPHRINTALQELHGETLDRLDLTGQAEDSVLDKPSFIGDMRPFKVLADIRLNSSMLFDKGQPRRLVDFFPASVFIVTIVSSSEMGGLRKSDVLAMFEGMSVLRGALPNLRLIIVEYEGVLDEESEEGVEMLFELCQRYEIEALRKQRRDE